MLDRPEAERVHVLRGTMTETSRPVLLASARKAFLPAAGPPPLLHVDAIFSFRAERAALRRTLCAGESLRRFVDAPLATVEPRHLERLRARARRGDTRDLTSVLNPHEPPEQPDPRVATPALDAEAAAQVFATLPARAER